MAIGEILPYFRREKDVEFSQLLLRRRDESPFNFAVTFLDRQPVVTNKPPPLISLYVLDHDAQKIPRWKGPTVVMPHANLFQVSKRLGND